MAFTILINENAGSIAQHGKDTLKEKLKVSLGDQYGIVRFFSARDCAKAFENIPKNAPILVGGGDGTISTAAAVFKKRNISFGILPLGTLNLFAKDLSLELDIFKLAKMYQNYTTIQIDAANVNGNLFLCNAMIGITSQIAKDREKHRHNETVLKWLKLVKDGLGKLSKKEARLISMKYEGTTEHKFIKAAIIANNEYEETEHIGTFKKKSLTDGKLSIYTVNPDGALESIALLSKLALGTWRNAPGLEYFDTKNLELDTQRRKTDVLLDGEIHRLKNPLIFSSEPASLNILVPKT